MPVGIPGGAPPGPPPPNPPEVAGPALGIEPVCGVAAVSTAYAAGPASETTSAAAASPAAIRRGSRPRPATASAMTSPASSTTHRSHGRKSEVRPSRKKPSTVVSDTAALATPEASSEVRCCQSSQAPVPTRAPIAGASATV